MNSKSAYLSILFVLLSFFAKAQKDDYNLHFGWAPAFHAETVFNFNDIYIGFGAGVENYDINAGVRLNFSFRPYYKKIQTEEEDGFIYQWREKRMFVSLDLDKRIGRFNLMGAESNGWVALRTAYMFGDYAGTKKGTEEYITLSPIIGICTNVDQSVYFKFGYAFLNDKTPAIPNSKFCFNITYIIPRD
jgi:hypothetical protein